MTDDQLESVFISISKSIDQMGDKVGRRIDGLSDRLTAVEMGLTGLEAGLTGLEVGHEGLRSDLKSVAEGVSLLLERRDEDELWRLEMEARVLKLEADVSEIRKRLRSA